MSYPPTELVPVISQDLFERVDLLISGFQRLHQEALMLHIYIPIHTEKKKCEYEIFYEGLKFKIYMHREGKSPVSFYFDGTLGMLCCQDQIMTAKQQSQFNTIILTDIITAFKEKNFQKEHLPK